MKRSQKLAIFGLCVGMLVIAFGIGVAIWSGDQATHMKLIATGFLVAIAASLGGLLDSVVEENRVDR